MSPKPDPESPPSPETSGVAVLDRAFALLAAFGANDQALTLTELSRRTGLYKSTVLRLLAALEHGGFIRRLADGQYALGPEPLRLAMIYQRSFRVGDVIEPCLKQLVVASGETASYYIRHGDRRVALYRVEPVRAVRVTISVGQEYPIGQGASGKVLLAFSEAPVAGAAGAASAAGAAVAREASAGSPQAMIRRRLWASSHGERDPETSAIAAPVFGSTGLQGAVSIAGPRSRLSQPEVMMAACHHLLEAAAEATRQLGGDGARYASALAALDIADFTPPAAG